MTHQVLPGIWYFLTILQSAWTVRFPVLHKCLTEGRQIITTAAKTVPIIVTRFSRRKAFVVQRRLILSVGSQQWRVVSFYGSRLRLVFASQKKQVKQCPDNLHLNLIFPRITYLLYSSLAPKRKTCFCDGSCTLKVINIAITITYKGESFQHIIHTPETGRNTASL